MSTISRASLEEEIYLRSLTGYLVGKNLLDGFKKIAVITYPDRICSAMSAALLSSYMSVYGYKNEAGMVFAYEENKLNEMSEKISRGGFDAVYISLGGEQKMSYVSETTKKIIEALRRSGFNGALAIHVRAWLATKQLSNILAEKELKDYLLSLKEIRVFTADLQNKLFLFHKIKIEETPKLSKFKEEKLTDEHVKLLQISLPPPE
ncbi:MAG: hypothetical protein ACP5LF_00510 [Nitrososphaeria archaeon]|nr:hypothetical protein [Conexivisphaerales archaeon]